MEISEEIKQLK